MGDPKDEIIKKDEQKENVKGRFDDQAAKLEELTKDQLKSELQLYVNLNNALRKLNKLTKKQLERKNEMYLPLTDTAYAELKKAYEDCGVLCDMYLQNEAAKDGNLKELTEQIKGISDVLRSDLNSLDLYNKVKPVTFPLLLEYSRNDIVNVENKTFSEIMDIGNEDLGTVGANMSSRIPFNYVMPDGREVKGVFTPENNFEPARLLQSKLEDLNRKHPSMKEFFNGIYKAFQESEPEKDQRPENYLSEFEFTKLFADIFNTYNKERKENNPNAEKNKERSTTRLFFQLLKSYDEKLAVDYRSMLKDGQTASAVIKASADFALVMYELGGKEIGMNHNAAMISAGSRLDSRNTAMSIVAEMMGVPNIIAKSTPMTVRYNNKEIRGTFMALGEGMGIDKPTLASTTYREDFFMNKNLKDASDLVVLDFICGNVDRHANNFLFKFNDKDDDFSKHTFRGLQGIDNDTSFGEFVPYSNSEHRQFMTSVNEIGFMAYSTAVAVKEMTADVLKFRLRGLGLTETQLDAAAKRLKLIQNAINKEDLSLEAQKKMLSEADFNKKRQKIRVIPDNKFNCIHPEYLADSCNMHHVYYIINDFKNQVDVSRDELLRKGVSHNDIYNQKGLQPNRVNKAFGYIIQPDKTAEMTKFLNRMSDVTDFEEDNAGNRKYVRTSKEFEKLRRHMKVFKDFCEEHENQLLTPQDYQIMRNFLTEILQDANEYLDHKGNGYHREYARNRITAVKEIKTAFQNQLIKDDPNLYYRMMKKTDAERTYEEKVYKASLHKYDDRNIQILNAKLRAEAERLHKAAEEQKAREQAAKEMENANQPAKVKS